MEGVGLCRPKLKGFSKCRVKTGREENIYLLFLRFCFDVLIEIFFFYYFLMKFWGGGLISRTPNSIEVLDYVELLFTKKKVSAFERRVFLGYD